MLKKKVILNVFLYVQMGNKVVACFPPKPSKYSLGSCFDCGGLRYVGSNDMCLSLGQAFQYHLSTNMLVSRYDRMEDSRVFRTPVGIGSIDACTESFIL